MGMIDLHMHSTASDGVCSPREVVLRAAGLGLEAIALTDHDTLAGVPEALAAGEQAGIRVIGGCEFSVAAPWGETHLLGYFLPLGHSDLEELNRRCRADRLNRAGAMVRALGYLGISLDFEEVVQAASTEAIGRPHIAKSLVEYGAVATIDQAFREYLGRGRPAYVPKRLPSFSEVADIVHLAGGLTVAAHLSGRATKAALVHFREQGLDGVEAAHPSHSPEIRKRICRLADALGLLVSGGSDWHGDGVGAQAELGSQAVPVAWLDAMDMARAVPAVPARSGQ